MELIDFTGRSKRKKSYAGANGHKISIMFNESQYMLKFPSMAKKNPNLSYSNGCFSEHLGSSIYNMIGIKAQETILGTYTINGKEKIVVACKDFTTPGIVLQDFGSMKNQIIDSERNGYGTELSDILQTFTSQDAMDPAVLEDHFWDMFIVDAFIGNWDRHNGNWGFLYDTITDTIELAPVYDCGSSLYPQADDTIMQTVLSDKNQRDRRIFEIPTSAITEHGKKIKYFDFISSLEHIGCNQALKRIVPRIDMEKVNRLIESTPALTDLQREFYATMLQERKSKILDFSLNKLEKERTHIYGPSHQPATSLSIQPASGFHIDNGTLISYDGPGGDVTVPEGITKIGNRAFAGCTGITAISIPTGITEIGNGAFSGCTSLKQIDIPEGVTRIGWAAFFQCTGLTRASIPASVVRVDGNAFYGCTGLMAVDIQSDKTNIAESAFTGCDNLKIEHTHGAPAKRDPNRIYGDPELATDPKERMRIQALGKNGCNDTDKENDGHDGL